MDIGNVLFEMDKLINYFNNNCKSKSLRISKEVKVFVESQQQEIERLKSDRWISVDKQLPLNCDVTEYLILIKPTNEHMIARFVNNQFYVDEWGYVKDVTHWQPLPAEPKEG